MKLIGSLQNVPFVVKFILLFFLIIGGTVCCFFLSEFLPLSGSIRLKAIQAIMVICSLLLPSIITALLSSHTPIQDFWLNRSISRKNIMRIICATLAINPCINLIHYYNKMLRLPSWMNGIEQWMKNSEEAAQKATELLLQGNSISMLIVNLLIVGLLAAISEEFLFRGILFKWFNSIIEKQQIVIWIIAVIFSAIHLQFYGFIPRLLLGAYLGYLLVWTNSIWAPILAHFTNNALGVLLFYKYAGTTDESMIENVGTGDTLWFSFVGLIIFYACLQKIKEEKS